MTVGTKQVDPIVDHEQVQWAFASAGECPDDTTEGRLISSLFRIPHPPFGSDQTFVDPVIIYRTKRRVLFYQRSGVVI